MRIGRGSIACHSRPRRSHRRGTLAVTPGKVVTRFAVGGNAKKFPAERRATIRKTNEDGLQKARPHGWSAKRVWRLGHDG
jgi:hypothetical protein